MDHLQTLLDAGAYSAAGSLLKDNVTLGKFTNDTFVLTDEGRALVKSLAGEEPETKKPARAAKAKSAKAKSAKAAEPEPVHVPEVDGSLESEIEKLGLED